MSLIDLWRNSPEQLEEKQVQQVIAFAGSGKLRDGNTTSEEFRKLIGLLPSSMLARFADECLSSRFDDSGLALQDIVNQAGRRLGFSVTDGRYRGTQGQIGFDGLWRSAYGDHIVVEVKTTDAYRIDLETLAGYRRGLIRSGDIPEDRSSILIVVGRQDTGELEAQIRGSRYAWDVRLLSIDSLFRLIGIREEIEGPHVARQINDILIPREYTRVDGIIDLVFAAAADVKSDVEDEAVIGEEVSLDTPTTQEKKPKFVPVSFHEECVKRIREHLGLTVTRRSKATYASPDGETALICAISREHPATSGAFYWFAFHPHQRDALRAATDAYVAFGCGSAERTLVIPFGEFEPWLDGMNMTRKGDREYWHVHIFREDGTFTLSRRADVPRIDLTQYVLPTAP